VTGNGASAAEARIVRWEARNRTARERAARILDEVTNAAQPDLAMLAVALRELRNLSGGAGAAPSDTASGAH
jgi:glutamate dehydrogenase